MLTLAVDIGGTKLAAGLVAEDGSVHSRATGPTPASAGPAAVLAAAAELAASVVSREVSQVAVATAGVVAPGSGRIVHATSSLPGWTGTDVAAGFLALGHPVAVLNDVHAHGLGEATHGVGRGHRSLLLVAVGTGIGGCFVSDGAVAVGANGAAGHVGHVAVPAAAGVLCPCGRTGHLEGLASGAGLLAGYRRRGGDAATTREVIALARTGDRLAQQVVQTCGEATGEVIGGLINVLDPEIVAVGGGLADAGGAWWRAVLDGCAAQVMEIVERTPVVCSALGNDAALVGAAVFAKGLRA